MGDEQQAAPAGEAKWGDPISEERQAELAALAERQRAWAEQAVEGRGGSPLSGAGRLTGADVCWLAARAVADQAGTPGEEHALAAAHERLRTAAEDSAAGYQARQELDLSTLHLEGAALDRAHLEWAALDRAHLEGAILAGAHLERAFLADAHLEGASLAGAHLERAILAGAHLERAILRDAHLERAGLRKAHLEGADLRLAFFDAAIALNDVTLTSPKQGTARLADVRWGGVNLSVVDWTTLRELGDERAAREWKWQPSLGQEDIPETRRRAHLDAYREAVRANRQLAVALQTQGLNEEAAHFAFRAQHLQRQVFRRQGRVGGYLFSLLLAAVSGYGYRLGQILVAYALVVLLFAMAFLGTGVAAGHAQLGATGALDAVQISLNAIHGRVFFAQFGLDTAQSWMATGESIVGIVIEGVFVAMLIQRFFGR